MQIVSESEEADEEEEEGEEEEEEEEPPAKRTRRRSKASTSPPAKKGRKKGAATTSKSPGRKRKAADPKPPKAKKTKEVKAKKEKPRPAGVLIPNQNIELLEKDPTFETREDHSLMPVKWATKAVILNDMEMLKDAIENRDIVASTVKSYNFYTFGHAVRELHASRGSREGNSAFLEDEIKFGERDYEIESLLLFCFTKGVSVETVQTLMNEISSLGESTLHEQEQTGLEHVWMAIRHGNRKLAGYFVSKGVEKHGFGFNFLHKEVLLNDNEKLSNFRSPSAKKKPLDNQNILPIHAACINPNGDYLRTLLNSVPEHSIADSEGFKPMHYAAACEGAGPLKILLARGADPNDPGPKGITPLMIACKHGRDEIVKELLTIGNEGVDDAMEDEEENKPKVSVDIKNKHTKAAIHYAAKNGHLSTIRLLVAGGAQVDLQTGSYRGNVTALMLAASKGYLDIVKALVELKASPDKKGKWNKTALMYAVKNGHSAVAAYLLRKIKIRTNSVYEEQPWDSVLHWSPPPVLKMPLADVSCRLAQLFISAGANPDALNKEGQTPIMVAIMQNNFPLIETLLECGANGSVGKTSNGSQVLHVQAEKADELDLSNLYPDAHVIKGLSEPSLECGITVYGNIYALDFNDTFECERCS
ncbi:PREDICTED: ankyrin-1-like [Acropora digitifera]|uniref:ankyrin-1-like n=1 Tax=Acropora digitifera TaxID=70779 RepID=UPI00077A7CFB|nr:PREDICTED: ankyrin-1-like [Acropora digitifera]